MDEFERRIRAARPESGHRTLPLTARAEKELAELLSAGQLTAQDLRRTRRARHARHARPARRTARPVSGRLMSLLAATAAAGAVVALGLTLFFPTAPTYAATPPLLDVSPVPQPREELLMDLSQKVMLGAESPTPDPEVTKISALAWSLVVMSDGERQSANVVNLDYDITVQPDGAVHQVVKAGPSVDADGRPVTEDVPAVGELMSEEEWPAGSPELRFTEPLPSESDQIPAYFAKAYETTELPDAALIINSVADLMRQRQLSSAEEATVLEYFAHEENLKVVGAVTDRLGRDAIAFSAAHEEDPSYEEYLLVATDSGQVLAVETHYIAQGRTDIPSPSVTGYFAWRR